MPFDNVRSLHVEEVDRPEIPLAETALACFRAPHPYLLFRRTALPALRHLVNADPDLQTRSAKLVSEIPAATMPRDLRAALKRRARRLIATSFIALTADGATAEAALATTCEALDEFSAAASWKERPVIRSFLDCAEIAVAVSLAYDWLYHKLTPCKRAAIESAIRRNVLEPALVAYEDRSLLWPKRRDNCTLVSNSGILIAALAVLRSQRELSSELVRRSLVSTWNVFSALAPDGAWREGLSYWSLAMRYARSDGGGAGEHFGRQFRPCRPARFRRDRRFCAACGGTVRRRLQLWRFRLAF